FTSKLIKVDNIENTDYRFIIIEYFDGFNIISDVWYKLNEKEKTELKAEVLDAAGYDEKAEYLQFLNMKINWYSDAQQLDDPE
ncbi:256_t:CDS:2, partial [Funneliformis caledonium]